MQVSGRRVSGADLDQGDYRQDIQHGELDAEQDLLEVRRHLDADVADGGHQDDPDDAAQQHPAAGRVAADARGAEQQEHVLARDLGQAGHDQHVGRDDPPAARPAAPRPERAGGPGERGAAVRVGLVQLAVADRGQQHRDEGEHGHGRRLEPDRQDDEDQRGRDAVRGRDRRRRDDGGRDQPESTGFEALIKLLFLRLYGLLGGGHVSPSWLRPGAAGTVDTRQAVRRTGRI